ncbi:PREDICTED: zinc-finger homeodomain protein 2-like [Nicotiana attenuata]|uniref:Zinc-finger homeodomain protein 2 n=1 Tax=Nicotiana attenuata TaxID=49451 RepID=A0A314LE23_NICAT|nr:PREDICTED: zinc-finger homeodomain protein 2-like [Nicotiana attenuata]OIT39905.1 zinc-finger homeodomain protein 2 [Nicotiana attenuata]
MEFDEEHEEQEEEIGNIHQISSAAATINFQTQGNNSVRGGVEEGVSTTVRKSGVRYRECLKNHAVGIGGHAVDGCGDFMPAGEEGTMDALKCAACNCHRNFHRKEVEGEVFHHTPPPHLTHHHPQPHHSHHPQFSPYTSYRTPHHPSGYLHVNPPPHQRPLALPSTSREDEDMSNPSSSGGGGGGSGGVGGSSRKRFRTKFTADQKDKMLAFAERLGWRMQKQDEALVQQFCAETNVQRHVFKVWMHNNKHTLGKKP